MSSPAPNGGDPAPAPHRDRLPFVVVPLLFAALALAGVAAVYGGARLSDSLDIPGGPAEVATSPPESTGDAVEPRRALRYAGLTRDEAARFAASDLATLIGSSSPEAIVTDDRELGRTRCFHAGHWRAYWRVSFAGGSPVYESRPDALYYCNGNAHVIEVTAPIRH